MIARFIAIGATMVVAHLAQAYGMGDADATIDGISYHLVWNNDDNEQNQAILISPQSPLSNREIATVAYTPAGETWPRTFLVTEIYGAAFAGGLASGSLSFPNVRYVRSDAFADCSDLSEISMGAVTFIDNRTFDRCTSLSKITLGGSTPPSLGSDVFREVASDATVYVHALADGFPGQDATWNGLKVAYIEGRIEKYYGVTVNGFEVGFGSGDGWTFAGGVLTLNGKGPYELSGSNTQGEVRVEQLESAEVTFKDLVLTTKTSRRAPYEVGNEENTKVGVAVNARLFLSGVNCLTNNAPEEGGVARYAGLSVHRGSHLTIDAKSGADEAKLTAVGAKYGAGIGGGEYCSTGVITINGGTIEAIGGYHAAGIGGGGYYGTIGETPGTIEINGGRIVAKGGASAPGIGTGYGLKQGAPYVVRITGGTVTAVGGTSAPYDISAADYDAEQNYVVTAGGSVNAKISGAMTTLEASGRQTWRVTVPELENGAVTLADLPAGYGTKDIFAEDGEISLWLPQGAYSFAANGVTYQANVDGNDTTAVRTLWTIGEGVTASWNDGTVAIAGAGQTDDFAEDAKDVPWIAAGLPVSAMTIPSAVTPGQNLVAGLADTVTVNGATLALMRQLVGGDAIIGGLTPAGATTIAVKDGKVKLTVQVETTTDLGEGADWQPATVEDGALTKEGDGVVLTLPAAAEKGFYILKTK